VTRRGRARYPAPAWVLLPGWQSPRAWHARRTIRRAIWALLALVGLAALAGAIWAGGV
jgi:hypothetical protein